MVRFKIVHLAPGDRWPDAGVCDVYNDRGREYLERWWRDNWNRFDPDDFRSEFKIYAEFGELVESPRWCLVLDEEPVMNEWGIESP